MTVSENIFRFSSSNQMVEQYSRTVLLPWWFFSFLLYIFQFLKGTLGALGSFIYLFINLFSGVSGLWDNLPIIFNNHDEATRLRPFQIIQ